MGGYRALHMRKTFESRGMLGVEDRLLLIEPTDALSTFLLAHTYMFSTTQTGIGHII